METRTILVVEERSVIQRWLRMLLGRTFPDSTVITADSVASAVDLLKSHDIEVALIDLHLVEGSGLEVIRKVIARNEAAKCVIITVHDRGTSQLDAIKVDALGSLFRERPLTLLTEQLRSIIESAKPGSARATQKLLTSFVEAMTGTSNHEEEGINRIEALSAREQEVLALIAKGLQVSQVAKALGITVNTTSSHIKNIYRKRHISSRAEAALEAQRLGLV